MLFIWWSWSILQDEAVCLKPSWSDGPSSGCFGKTIDPMWLTTGSLKKGGYWGRWKDKRDKRDWIGERWYNVCEGQSFPPLELKLETYMYCHCISIESHLLRILCHIIIWGNCLYGTSRDWQFRIIELKEHVLIPWTSRLTDWSIFPFILLNLQI